MSVKNILVWGVLCALPMCTYGSGTEKKGPSKEVLDEFDPLSPNFEKKKRASVANKIAKGVSSRAIERGAIEAQRGEISHSRSGSDSSLDTVSVSSDMSRTPPRVKKVPPPVVPRKKNNSLASTRSVSNDVSQSGGKKVPPPVVPRKKNNPLASAWREALDAQRKYEREIAQPLGEEQPENRYFPYSEDDKRAEARRADSAHEMARVLGMRKTTVQKSYEEPNLRTAPKRHKFLDDSEAHERRWRKPLFGDDTVEEMSEDEVKNLAPKERKKRSVSRLSLIRNLQEYSEELEVFLKHYDEELSKEDREDLQDLIDALFHYGDKDNEREYILSKIQALLSNSPDNQFKNFGGVLKNILDDLLKLRFSLEGRRLATAVDRKNQNLFQYGLGGVFKSKRSASKVKSVSEDLD